ncbi:phosphoribosylformylglycinamidine synthase I [Chlorobaculum parvum NCIB 8327]|uniref:Phosphoribosylformylglycinamidine synthase subunit PurQ n=1 Tax=Chlorobaculum parvum (strain DSM 263 / NCIMB 8327) TaxID=517417 RepID=PURQ_CHLP8|nr:phosphoribosylformylglycinamidine synthase subunit PurQ [Chlorobaculum parvum]B3QMT1.1 RecName: Full=Phosphoribosylformylglycinamidine synthase subunit PurQ; Short=FGAM synthase; AltName: Full=Formylglycinamide ribonucleotide amidotransferase subunit I; Short=FGAR amidotransferase I; Short=FGAR-AT I; AltName: Full=Glutaminase PurQ; AltName: Full=Phosphoribosylformylglycinamidine synthase subunit I [Chlorobaculum parvum NCIB 8327]ACF11234.1 phosphoribosylformylglycinamidine synthase I [Chloroba
MADLNVGVVVFPGSNCDHDTEYAVASFSGVKPVMLWHNEHDLKGCDAIILPGGFSYGDYLRCGSIARFSPIMREVIDFAGQGRPVLGICNGFQVLVESGLLEGALIRNAGRKFICRQSTISVVNNSTIFTDRYEKGEVLRVPVAHGEGNYYASVETIDSLESNGQVVFRYTDAEGNATAEANFNGSLNNIAGITNKQGNVLGLMPHPERASEELLGSGDGRRVFESLFAHLAGTKRSSRGCCSTSPTRRSAS